MSYVRGQCASCKGTPTMQWRWFGKMGQTGKSDLKKGYQLCDACVGLWQRLGVKADVIHKIGHEPDPETLQRAVANVISRF